MFTPLFLFFFPSNENEGHRPWNGRRDVRVPAEIHEGRPVQPSRSRLFRRRDGILRCLVFRRPARDGECCPSARNVTI